MNSTHEKFVYFDLGKVLVHFDHAIAVRQLSARAGRPPEVVRQVVFDSNLQNHYECGYVNCAQFAEQVNLQLETDLPAAEIHEAISAIFEPNHSILPALELVRRSGVRMGILSNTCHAHWQWIGDRRWPMLADWFDVVVLSYEVRSMKPDSRIYEVCEERAGCQGDYLFFTDDRSDNVTAAAERGWATHRYETTEALLPALQRWLERSPG